MSPIRILIDENIPFAREAFGTLGEVVLLPAPEISNRALRHADALIVRAVIRVDAGLLEGTPVRFVGTATIGTDHVDRSWLREHGIAFADAAGCNARPVAEYTLTAMVEMLMRQGRRFSETRIGIIGVGRIGSQVAEMAAALGMQVWKNDPPLQRATGGAEFLPLEKILQADVITLHVPLTRTGPDATFHLLDRAKLRRIRKDAILINTSRGAVIDNAALREILRAGAGPRTVLDVWEDEPQIDAELLERVEIGTPHIAGYSLEGKARGTQMVYEALCRFLHRPPLWKPELPQVENPEVAVDGTLPPEAALSRLLRRLYDIRRDDRQLRTLLRLSREQQGRRFEQLRKTYPLRREFSNFRIRVQPYQPALAQLLQSLGFRIAGEPPSSAGNESHE